MKVAVLGGTGRMGRVIAKQLSRKNEIAIGSRDAARAREAAKGIGGSEGMDYPGAAKWAEGVVFAIPYPAMKEAARTAGDLAGKLVISAVNPMKVEGGMFRHSMEEGSAAEELARMLPGARVATAFNNVSSLFFEREAVAPLDILIATDGRKTFDEVAGLVKSIPNLRPLYAGPLSEARTVEMITPLVLNLSKLNGTKSLSTRFVSPGEAAR
jgi:8-hydroxy-5-deazaflavin:NADPH oxidoreductase